MDTQLLRLEAPYSIICNNKGQFGLHIATLIVTKETSHDVSKIMPVSAAVAIASYPVVRSYSALDGKVWTDTELSECHQICRQKENVSAWHLKKVMEYCAKHNVMRFSDRIPIMFDLAMMENKCQYVPVMDYEGKQHSLYEVELVFEESQDKNTCMVYSAASDSFYFYEYFANEESAPSMIPTNLQAIEHLAELRNSYLRIFHHVGLKRISFTTQNADYQWFVDRLNETD